jgi:hypothetical protein
VAHTREFTPIASCSFACCLWGAGAYLASLTRLNSAVEKVVIVIDSGHAINPHNAAEQLEGGVC